MGSHIVPTARYAPDKPIIEQQRGSSTRIGVTEKAGNGAQDSDLLGTYGRSIREEPYLRTCVAILLEMRDPEAMKTVAINELFPGLKFVK